MGENLQDIRLIRWIEDRWKATKHNLSSSGLPEPVLSQMGVDTSFERMKKDAPDPVLFFRERLCDLYGFPEKNVFLTTGGSESIQLMSLLAKTKHLPVFVGLPEYEPIFTVPESLGNPTHIAGFDSIEQLMETNSGKKAFFFSNPNNPLGNFHRNEFLQSIRERQFRSGGFMYADEAFLEFSFKTKPRSFYEDSTEILVNGSMTKFYGFSAFRVGWIVGPEEDMRTLRNLRNITGIRNPEYPLWIAGQFLENRRRFLERAEKIVRPNLEILRKFIKEHEALSWEEPASAAYALINYSYKMDSEKLCQDAFDQEKILIDPGDYFGAPGSFRLCFTEEPEKFKESLTALDSFLSGIPNQDIS